MNLIASALVPVIVVIIYIYQKDKYEKEPKKLLLYCFLLGAIVSILISTIFYIISDNFILLNDNNVTHQFVKAFFVVALIEEFSKYFIVRFYAQPKSAFNEPLDGIIYAVMVSMGFAAVENIFYVFEGGFEVAAIRTVTAIPAHATFVNV